MSSRNPSVSNSTTFNKKVKKSLPPVITETAVLISEAPDFLRSLNIMRAPHKPVESPLPCSKTETEEIIAAMKETLMASPAPSPVILPKKRKRPNYDFMRLAEKIAKHDHNKILDPKIDEDNSNTVLKATDPIPVVVNNKGKKLMSQVEVGLIKQNRLRRKREIPLNVIEKDIIPSKKAKIDIQEKNLDSIPVKKSKRQTQSKKKSNDPKTGSIEENLSSKIQTRNSRKNFIKESLSNNSVLWKEDKSMNNNELSSSFVDFEFSQEKTDSPLKNKTVKVTSLKPKARNRRKPGVFFGSRKKKRNLKTENKTPQPTSSNVEESSSDTISKLEYSDLNKTVLEQIQEDVLQNCTKELEDNKPTESIVQKEPQEPQIFAQEPRKLTVKEENKVTAPISTDTTELKEPEEVAEPSWHTQSDSFFDLPSTISFGSILSSVNQASELCFITYSYYIGTY